MAGENLQLPLDDGPDDKNASLSAGIVKDRPIVDEMSASYLDYALSVIVSRALPDVRDGLKPVNRRILYSMWETGVRKNSKFSKSARIVGAVMGNYHPHGDSAIYAAMVRQAQYFSMRYMMVDGQGNFGSLDGDSAAAMRYTEARMERIAEEMLKDIDKETVDFRPNYDGHTTEPSVLPASVPNLLINGTVGIAVGMATSIPPHNLKEVIDATIHVIENPDCEILDLLKFVKGPDFPLGAEIYGAKDIAQCYLTGRGRVVTRAKADIEEKENGRFMIVVREIPYMVNKATLLEKMAALVRDKKIMGISDLRDGSDRDNPVRIEIELKKDAYPKKILNKLYKHTQLQDTFHVNMVALVDGVQPRLLNLKEVLEYYVKHRFEVIERRTKYELKVAEERAHILEGLKIALDNIDAIITTIKKSDTKEDAHAALMKKFKLSDKQSKAILEMRLQSLAGLERKKVEDELKEKLALIKKLKGILADPKKIFTIIKDSLAEIKEKYGDDRRTKVNKSALGQFSEEDLVADEPMIVTLTVGNYIKRLEPGVYRAQHRGGKGVTGMQTKEEDVVEHILACRTHDRLLFFTNKGRVFQLKVYEIPKYGRTAKGQPIVNLLQLGQDEKVTAMLRMKKEMEADGKCLFFVTKNGTVKKTDLEAYRNMRTSGLIAIKIKEDDELRWVRLIGKDDNAICITADGQSIRFKASDVRSMGRASTGVRGIRLKNKEDKVVSAVVVKPEDVKNSLLVLSENGYGKRSDVSLFKVQNRGGSGIKVQQVTKKTGPVVGAVLVRTLDNDLIVISSQGIVIRTSLSYTPRLGRATQGVRIMRLKSGDRVSSLAICPTAEEVAQESGGDVEIGEEEEVVEAKLIETKEEVKKPKKEAKKEPKKKEVKAAKKEVKGEEKPAPKAKPKGKKKK